MQGTLIFFNPTKRHGYIRTEDGERLRVEESGFEPGHLLGDRCAGTALIFERVEATPEPHAVNVRVVELAEPRRARSRKRH